jgi:putative oxidoreductase
VRFRYLTDLLEVAGGIGILAPSISVFAAILLPAVDAGAFAAQVAVLHMDWMCSSALAIAAYRTH